LRTNFLPHTKYTAETICISFTISPTNFHRFWTRNTTILAAIIVDVTTLHGVTIGCGGAESTVCSTAGVLIDQPESPGIALFSLLVDDVVTTPTFQLGSLFET
jgi:hypothetical protein